MRVIYWCIAGTATCVSAVALLGLGISIRNWDIDSCGVTGAILGLSIWVIAIMVHNLEK